MRYSSWGIVFLLRLASAGGESKRKVNGNDEMRIAVDLLEPETESGMAIFVGLIRFEFECIVPP